MCKNGVSFHVLCIGSAARSCATIRRAWCACGGRAVAREGAKGWISRFAVTEHVDMMELPVSYLIRGNGLAIIVVEASDPAPFAPFGVYNHIARIKGNDAAVKSAKVQPERRTLRTDLWVRWKKPTKEHQAATRLEFFTQRRYDDRHDMGRRPATNVFARTMPLRPEVVELMDLISLQLVVDLAVLTKSRADGVLLAFVCVEPPSYDWDKLQDLCTHFRRELKARSNRRRRA